MSCVVVIVIVFLVVVVLVFVVMVFIMKFDDWFVFKMSEKFFGVKKDLFLIEKG